MVAAPPQPAEQQHIQHRRHECVGISYFSAWMRTANAAPVCIGFSRVRPTDHDTPKQAADPQQQPEAGQDFKQVCIGFSSYTEQADGTLLPHCEGIELVLEGPAATSSQQDASQAMPAAALQGSQQHHSSSGSSSQHAAAAGGARLQGAHSPQAQAQPPPQQQQPQQEGGQEGAQGVPRLPTREQLMSKAAANYAALQKALRNEGYIKFKPMPKDWQEAQGRLWAEASHNGAQVAAIVQRLACTAYQLGVKPIADTLGITPRHKS